MAVIETGAWLFSSLGVVVGLLLSVATKTGIMWLTPLIVQFEVKGMLIAAVVALLGGVLGALYPALRASNQDPVKALAYE